MNGRQRRGVSLATLLATLAGVGLLLMTVVIGAGAANGTVLTIGSGSTSVGSSTTTTVSVTALAAEDATFNGYDLTLSFDQSIVAVSNVAFGPGWSNLIDPDWSTPGKLRVSSARVSACAAPCQLFTITWNGVAAGVSNIVLTPNPPFEPLGKASTPEDLSNEITPFATTNGTVTVNGPTATNTPVTPATNTPVTPATNTPVTPATNTPVTPATNTPVTPATNTPVTPATNTPVTPGTTVTPGTATNTATQTNTATATSTGTITPSSTTGAGTATPTGTSTTPTATPTVNRGPLTYKLYLPMVADDGIPGSGQQVKELATGVLEGVFGSLLGAHP